MLRGGFAISFFLFDIRCPVYLAQLLNFGFIKPI